MDRHEHSPSNYMSCGYFCLLRINIVQNTSSENANAIPWILYLTETPADYIQWCLGVRELSGSWTSGAIRSSSDEHEDAPYRPARHVLCLQCAYVCPGLLFRTGNLECLYWREAGDRPWKSVFYVTWRVVLYLRDTHTSYNKDTCHGIQISMESLYHAEGKHRQAWGHVSNANLQG